MQQCLSVNCLNLLTIVIAEPKAEEDQVDSEWNEQRQRATSEWRVQQRLSVNCLNLLTIVIADPKAEEDQVDSK